MHLEQLEQQIKLLSIGEKITLINNIALSLRDKNRRESSKKNTIDKMKGFLKNETKTPSDVETKDILQKHKENKYL